MRPKKTSQLNTQQWKQARDLYEECVDLPLSERKELIEREAVGRPWLKAEVEALLEKTPVAREALEKPFLRVVHEAPATPAAAETGKVIAGKYTLLRKLGHGGMAEVFLALSRGPASFERHVAIKRVLPAYCDDPQFRALFESEARISGLLAHSNIVHVYDFFEFEGSYFLAMEYVEGLNLAQILDEHQTAGSRFPLECALHIVTEICKGLEYAHGRCDDSTGVALNIVHRDISPKNVMVSFSGDIKIVDFGIAKAKDRARLTQPGLTRGTASYLSPESAAGMEIDHRADIFASGLILYELISGVPLFDGEDLISVVRLIEKGELPAIRIEQLSVDSGLKAILHKALERDRLHRYQTAGALQEDLQEYLARKGKKSPQGLLKESLKGFQRARRQEKAKGISTSPALPPPIEEPKRILAKGDKNEKRPSWPVGLSALMIFLSLVAGFWLKRDERSAGPTSEARSEAPVPPTPSLKPKTENAQKPEAKLPPATETDRTSPESPAERLYHEGEKLAQEGDLEQALDKFRSSRLAESSYLPAWLYEIYSLTQLGRDEEARNIARALVTAHPHYRKLPMLQTYLQPERK